MPVNRLVRTFAAEVPALRAHLGVVVEDQFALLVGQVIPDRNEVVLKGYSELPPLLWVCNGGNDFGSILATLTSDQASLRSI